MKVGDVITVIIMINDKATFGNTSGRSQTAQETVGFDWTFGLNNSHQQGQCRRPISTPPVRRTVRAASTVRKKFNWRSAAVVTRVLPNGNLIISGTQEVRVNFEMRQLQIAGIVRPRDISKENTIAYDKIAEARISYGGQGRISEVQQPAWGQQIFDA